MVALELGALPNTCRRRRKCVPTDTTDPPGSVLRAAYMSPAQKSGDRDRSRPRRAQTPARHSC